MPGGGGDGGPRGGERAKDALTGCGGARGVGRRAGAGCGGRRGVGKRAGAWGLLPDVWGKLEAGVGSGALLQPLEECKLGAAGCV